MNTELTYLGEKLIFDNAAQMPSYFFISPLVWKLMKKRDKMFSRRDRRRKHKRHPPLAVVRYV